jgi:hypothetical protein
MRVALPLLSAALIGLVATPGAQPPATPGSMPQAYTLSIELGQEDARAMLTVYRDGSKARTEMAIQGAKAGLTSLYDFDAHKVYWIMSGGPQETCTFGRYESARAPIGEDPVTGSAQTLAGLPKGTRRKFVRQEAVNGIPARLEEIAVPPGASPKDEVRPTRVWLSDPDGIILKMEGAKPGGKPFTVMEVKQFLKDRPPARLFSPPAGCQATNSAMDDSGMMRAHAEAEIGAKAAAEVNLADPAGRRGGAAVLPPAKAAPAPAAVTVTATAVEVKELPGPAPCGRKLQAKATVTVDGPATVWYRFHTNVLGLEYLGGALGTIRINAAGSATISKDVKFPASRAGEVRFEAAVQPADGRRGAATAATAAAFNVVCGGDSPGK